MIMNERGIKRLEMLEGIIADWTREYSAAQAECRTAECKGSPDKLQEAYFDIKYGNGFLLYDKWNKQEMDILKSLGFKLTFVWETKGSGNAYMATLPKGDVING